MLSEAKMVKARKAVESLYDGICTVTEHQKVVKPNKSTSFSDVPVLTDEPCRLSYSTITDINAREDESSSVVQVTKLFISPDVTIKTGSKISVTQHGQTTDYKSSGQPAIYQTHQEIILELFKGWS